MLRVIREVSPTYVVGENVYGLLNWNGGMVFDEIQADLEAEGYEVIPVILPACGIDAPHERKRIWFVAYNKNVRRHNNNSGSGRLRIFKQVEMEESERLCSENDKDERWIQEPTNAQRNNKCTRRRGGGSYKPEQVRQPKVEFENCKPLGEQSQQREGEWSSKTERQEQMVRSNIYKQPTYPFGVFRHERRSNECESESGKQIGASSNSSSNRLHKGKPGNYRPVKDGLSDGFGEVHTKEADSNANSVGLQNSQQEFRREGKGPKNKQLEGLLGELCIDPWGKFPTQSPVRSRNDGFSRSIFRYINQEVYDRISNTSKENKIENLSEVWERIQQEEVWEKIRRFYSLESKDILLQTVQLYQTGNIIQFELSPFSEIVSKTVLSKLRKYEEFRRSPQGQELQEQRAEQLGNIVSFLPHEIPLAAKTFETAISKFETWHREESLMAYGNAIVPWLAVKIFKAINTHSVVTSLNDYTK